MDPRDMPLSPAQLERVDEYTDRVPGGRGEWVEVFAGPGVTDEDGSELVAPTVSITTHGQPVVLDEPAVRGLALAVQAARARAWGTDAG